MMLTDVRIDRYGSLQNTSVDNLSRTVTVLYGPNGAGKTTFVRFLRGLFFGFRRQSALPYGDQLPADAHGQSGLARVATNAGVRTLHRAWTVQGTDPLTVVDEFDRSALVRQDNLLPAWVTDDVYREIFSAGHDEADRFDLLTRLCLESGGRTTSEHDLRQAEAALTQVIRDRDGNGVQGGVVHRISELRRRQGDIQSEIAALRKPNSDVQARIDQLLRDIDAATMSIDRIDARIREIDAEIARLEALLIELRRRNVLPLDRVKLDQEIHAVTAKLNRWREIRQSIARETETLRGTNDSTLRADESVRSIRAIISRLEERAASLTERWKGVSPVEVERHPDADVLRQIRAEIAALCQYFGHHERTTAKHIESLQSLTAERTLADASQMERLLEEQLATLRAELARCENVLAPASMPLMAGTRYTDACRFGGHQELTGLTAVVGENFQTVAEVEAQIARLKAERSRLVAERSALEQTRIANRAMVERLRQELSGVATLEQLDILRARFAEIDAEVALLEDQRRQLDRAEQSFREVVERLKGRGQSRVFELATAYARRLTDGEIQQVSATIPDRLVLTTISRPESVSLQQLSKGTRDQIGLALRIALTQVRAEANGHVPLVLDDVFIATDNARATAAVQLLTEIAAQGQQIIFLTCQKDVRDLFARFRADVRSFSARVEVPVPPPLPSPPPLPIMLQAYVEPPVEVRPAIPQPVVVKQPELPAQVVVEPVQMPGATNWLFYLEVDHGVEDLAGITLGELEALRSAGILTIDDLLTHTVPQLESATRLKGFTMSVDRLHALQGQAELTTRVPMLRRSDAALLYAAGIHSVDELSRLRPETVYDRVTEFQRSDSGARYRRGGRLIDRQQAINWARFGQFTRSLDEARRSRSLFATRPTGRAATLHGETGTRSSATAVAAEAETVATRRRPRRRNEDLDIEERRARRQARRRKQVSRLRTQEPVASDDEESPAERTGGMRFFLSRTSDVEKAPSIGPKTAEMLAKIGVRTVEDLLAMAPDRISEKLGHRRLTPSVIQQWQLQSRMMCSIPELRGHDAQILVACNIVTPESLAAQKPTDLLSVVEPFCRSKEGERILRNSRKPDLAEVTEWIQWAANARSLRAA